jgi:hypothetical protein
LADGRLVDARADRGLIYADLGESVIKQAVARPNESAVKGFRTVLAFKTDTRAFFLFGFAKSESENITANALTEFRATAKELLALSDAQIATLIDERNTGSQEAVSLGS